MKSNVIPVTFPEATLLDGFWHHRQYINSQITIHSIENRFRETGRFDAFRFNWKEGDPHKPHIFWDSDIAKWMESVAYIIRKHPFPELERIVDEIVDLIEQNQGQDGYFNVYFTVVEPDQRWKRRTDHELYCAGHLIEAAVAYAEATGKEKFLRLMMDYADHIEQIFVVDQSAAFTTCGHEEIELALVKLYRYTGKDKYLKLSRFFIDNRSKDAPEQYYDWVNAYYAQDHLPVREQTTAEGHAVRAVYLYSAMADLALELDDKDLANACRTIFRNIVQNRMYITGGIGSADLGEAFTIDYDLPNLSAYSESCAAIGLVFFAQRMMKIEQEAIYADIIERVLYNGFLSSVSLDGKSFFYENPLEIQPQLLGRDRSALKKRRLPETQRREVFGCSCCPPNITRLMATIGDLLYTVKESTLYVHQYMASQTNTIYEGEPLIIEQHTAYPLDGDIMVSIKGKSVKRIAFRVPSWCHHYTILMNGVRTEGVMESGYVVFDRSGQSEDHFRISLEMVPQLMEASPYVQENAGRVALQRGPVVYCLEAVDNGGLLRDVRLDDQASYTLVKDGTFGIPVIKTTGYRRDVADFQSLYQSTSELVSIPLTFIPYFGFANRGESEMVMWVLKHT
jgi:uncharacterized protein